MEVTVDGWRASASDWQAAKAIPREQLPQLSPAQREVARKMGISEEDYARSALAGERTSEALLNRAQQLARLLEGMAKQIERGATLARLVLRTLEHRYEALFKIDNRTLLLRIDEDMVDDYFDGGSAEAKERLQRALRRTLTGAAQ